MIGCRSLRVTPRLADAPGRRHAHHGLALVWLLRVLQLKAGSRKLEAGCWTLEAGIGGTIRGGAEPTNDAPIAASNVEHGDGRDDGQRPGQVGPGSFNWTGRRRRAILVKPLIDFQP